LGRRETGRVFGSEPAAEEKEPNMTDPGLSRAAERVRLACTVLSAAANDLRVEHDRNGMMAVDDAAHLLEAEMERVCELAEELTTLARNLTTWPAREAAGLAEVTAHH
jgi:hypothetical protein